MVELKKVNLGDIITFKNGKKKPAEEGTIPIYGGNGILGYTDHSEAHCTLVAERSGYILRKLEYKEKVIELAKMAGFMHDIGNAVNRSRHAEYGAILTNDLLKDTDIPLEDRVTLMSAIGNHDESTGGATDAVSAGGGNFGFTV